jgi:hypothetical protein
MTYDGMRRANNNYGDSPVRRSSLPIASSRLASSTRGTASRLPFGSAVESWPPQPSACPATQPPQLCRALMMQAASPGSRRAVLRRSEKTRFIVCERRRRRRIHSAMRDQLKNGLRS